MAWMLLGGRQNIPAVPAQELPRGQELAAVPGPPGAPHHAAAPPQGAGHGARRETSENASTVTRVTAFRTHQKEGNWVF